MSAVIGELRAHLGLDSAKFERGVNRVQAKSKDLQSDFSRLAAAAGAFGAAFSFGGALSMVDQITSMRNSLLSVTGTVDLANERLETLADIASRTRSPLEGTAQLFQRVSSAANELGASEADLLRFTENVGLALGATGAGGAAAEGALQQLAQAMAGTNIQAEEFNSILDGAYPLAQAAARGIDEAGGSVGRLRQLVVQGKISSDEFFEGILSQTDELEAAFARTTPTISQSFQVLSDSMAMFLGGMDQASGVSSAISQGILLVADNVDRLAAYAAAAGGVWAGAYAAGVVRAAIATGSLSAALVTLRGALIRTGVGALVVGAGELLYRFSSLANGVGGVGNAFSLLKNVAVETFDRIGIGVGAIVPYMQAAAAGFKSEFLYALGDMVGAFSQFVGSIAKGLNDLFGLNLTTSGLDQINTDLISAGTDARQAADSFSAMGSAAIAAATAPLESLQALRDTTAATAAAMDAGAGAAGSLAGALGGDGAGGAGGSGGGVAGAADKAAAASEAASTAIDHILDSMAPATRQAVAFQLALRDAAMDMEEIGERKADIVIGGIDGMASAWGDFLGGGFRKFTDFRDGVMDSLRQMLADMAAMAARNRILIPIATAMTGGAAGPAMAGGVPGMGGGGGILGSIGGALGGLASSFGAGLSGFAVNLLGLNGAAGGIGGALGFVGGALQGATASLGGFATALGALAGPVAIVAGIFMAFRKKTAVLDQGLRVTMNGMDALIETFERTRTTRLFGLIRNTDTDYDPASADVANPITAAYRDLHRSITGMAASLGIGADAFEGFSHEFRLSLQGMTEEQQQAALAAEFEKIADALATTAGVTARFIREGETASQALQRMSTNLAAANGAMTTLGFSLFDVSLRGANAASSFVELFGSLDQFASSMSFYHENFYSLAERAQEAARQFRTGLSDLGVSAIPQTIEGFRALVDRLMDAGRTQAAAGVIQLAPLFQQMLGLRDQANPTTSTGNVVSFADRLEEARRAAQGVSADRYSTRFDHERAQASAAQRVLNPNANRTQEQMLTEMQAMRQEQARMRDELTQLGKQTVTHTRHAARILEEQNVVGMPPVRTR